ncbi:MAG: hypothetical protein HYX47_05415 [Burkholderiales bacterium]|nr:hypothetical protein [Burkholderiales bacterium]
MSKSVRRVVWVLAGLGLVLAALAVTAVLLVPSDDELGARIKAQAQAKLGIEVTLGAVHWELLPIPLVVITDAATVQAQPISFKRLVARPNMGALLHRQLRFDDVLIEGGVMPQMSLRGLHIQPSPPDADTTHTMVQQLRFRDLSWVTRHGIALEFDGEALFDPGWRPRQVEVVRPGVKPDTRITLQREGDADRWQVVLLLGGGTANGHVELKPGEGGKLQLAGELAPKSVDVEAAMTAFKRHSTVSGRATGHTHLSATGANVAELARSLHTRTSFTMAAPRLLHINVDKAISTLGKDRAGQTSLKSLTGQMDTQNTPDGMVVRYSGLQARGETFSASGVATIANRQINAQMVVNPDGLVPPIPLTVAGTLAAPHVSMAPGTVVKAAVGTVGAAIGKLFGVN